MTRHPPAGGTQLGLFGGSVPIGGPRAGPRVESNDVELMHTVAANAIRCGYLLVGANERVYAPTEGTRGDVVRVPRYEEDAVHQLLARRWLTVGATQRVACGSVDLLGAALLVPKDTRTRVTRWEHTHRPPSWPTAPAPPRAPRAATSCSACGDTGTVPDAGQPRPCPWCTHGDR